MGVTLSYRTAAPVPTDVADTIRSELPAANAGVRWVVLEPIWVAEADGGHLAGRSKLNLHPWPDEYAEAMAGNAEADTARLVGRLLDWSARFGLTWEFAVDGTPLGRIVNGDDADDVAGKLEAMAAVADELSGFDPITGDPAAGDAPAAGVEELFDNPDDEDEPPPEGFHPRLFGG